MRTLRVMVALALAVGMGGLALAAETDTRLPDAAQRGDAAAVRALLRDRVDVNSVQPDGTTALHWAVRADDLTTVGLLLGARANPNASTRYSVTPLMLAALNGNATIIERLLRAGADPNAVLLEGQTPLMTAARTGRVEAVKVLLAHRAAPDSRDAWQGQTALMWAAAEGHSDVVRVLIEAGADVNAVARVSTLPQARNGGVRNIAFVPAGGMTPLMLAARHGRLDVVRALAAAGANVKYQDPGGVTPLITAIWNGHYDTAAVLLDAGADPDDGSLYVAVHMHNLVVNDESPVPRALDHRTSLDIIGVLLDRGANPNIGFSKRLPNREAASRPTAFPGVTPLGRAALSADVEAIRLLLAKAADPAKADSNGLTPLMAAAKGVGLIRFGGDNEAGPLAYRTKGPNDDLEAVRLLLDRGADPNTQERCPEPVAGGGGGFGAACQGFTALHYAAQRGANDIVKLLASRGAVLDVKDRRGRTPADVAKIGIAVEFGLPPVPHEDTAKLVTDLMHASGPGQ